jgi:hypothetical protein
VCAIVFVVASSFGFAFRGRLFRKAESKTTEHSSVPVTMEATITTTTTPREIMLGDEGSDSGEGDTALVATEENSEKVWL